MEINYSGNNMLVSFDYFLKNIDLGNAHNLKIKTSGSWLNVHPAALVFAAALAQKVGKQNVSIDNAAGKSGLYLDRMGLYDYSKTPSPYSYEQHEEAGRFVPVRQVHDSSEQSKFITDLIPLLHLAVEESQVIYYVIGELVRNVLEHSMSKDGAFVAAQYRPKSKVLSFGVCDTGIGLTKSLSKYHFPKDDADAIKLALSPGVSGTTSRDGGTGDNAGAGLYIVKNLAKMTRNYFVIYSGTALYKLLKYDKRIMAPRIHSDPFEDRHNLYTGMSPFHGTLVGVDIALDDTENFNSLMETIKTSYSKALREKKERKYKEVRFE